MEWLRGLVSERSNVVRKENRDVTNFLLDPRQSRLPWLADSSHLQNKRG
jgi:hypothetical protein